MGEEKTPELLAMLFGDAARTARQAASERLLRWAGAMEGWLEERRRLSASTHKQARQAWGRLMRERGKMPWELERGDFEAHAAWMQAQGYATTTIANALGIFSNFYRWCGEHEVDAVCGAGFDPAREARRPKTRRYAGAALLSLGEAAALVRTLRKDASPLGRRDTAFFLARLRLGAPLGNLQRLQWGMLEQDEAGVWVRWRAEGERGRMPGEVWEAIQIYLAASGRREGMEAEKFVFAPLRYPGVPERSWEAEGWIEGQYVSTSSLLASLKLYGRAAGIGEEKLTLQALRRTATRLRLDEGASLEEMQAFLDSREGARSTRFRLGWLPELPEEGEQALEEGEAPKREAKPFREGEGIKHGFYRKQQPAGEVQAIMEQGIQGLGEEIEGLRELSRGLVEREAQAASRMEAALIMEAYTKAASRLGELRAMEKAERERKTSGQWAKDREWVEGQFAMFRRVQEDVEGYVFDEEEILRNALGSEQPMEEEVATVRYMLRKARGQAQEMQEAREYARLVEIYGMGCIRLGRLLRREDYQYSRIASYLRASLQQALKEVTEEMGLK